MFEAYITNTAPVSYTHLDVYKRQVILRGQEGREPPKLQDTFIPGHGGDLAGGHQFLSLIHKMCIRDR